jgi:hypothetical protein
MNWVRAVLQEYASRVSSDGELLILVALAAHADRDGVSYPGIDLMAASSRRSRRGVYLILDSLKRLGAIEVVRRGGGRATSTRYQLVVSTRNGAVAAAPFPPKNGAIAAAPFPKETVQKGCSNGAVAAALNGAVQTAPEVVEVREVLEGARAPAGPLGRPARGADGNPNDVGLIESWLEANPDEAGLLRTKAAEQAAQLGRHGHGKAYDAILRAFVRDAMRTPSQS